LEILLLALTICFFPFFLYFDFSKAYSYILMEVRKMPETAAETIKTIPIETRFLETTKGNIAVWMVLSNILRDTVGEEKWKEIVGPIFTQAGAGVKAVKDQFGLVGDDAKAASEALILAPLVGFGPEPVIEITEATKDRVVSKQTICPLWNRVEELGLKGDPCTFGHICWSEAGIKAINPNLTFQLTKAMPKGDPYCEWVVELKS
jgi:hypothetical protein